MWNAIRNLKNHLRYLFNDKNVYKVLFYNYRKFFQLIEHFS